MTTSDAPQFTPLMKQYHAIKAQHPDTLLLFQVGDFYELFFDDAKTAAQFLGIALTSRGKNQSEPIPLCGVPVHAIDHYLHKLVRGGFKVAICDQLEQPQPGKVVERGVTRVLTPGTLTDAQLLDEKSASYLLSFFATENEWALVFGELLTAQLFATIVPAGSERIIESELVRFFPDEIVIAHNQNKTFQAIFKQLGYVTTTQAVDEQQHDAARTWIEKQLHVDAQSSALKSALESFYAFIAKNQQYAIEQFKNLYLYKPEDFLMLDAATQRNLEVVKNNQDASRKYSLLSVIDRATTGMGSRMIKKWLLRPLVKKEAIEQRYQAIELLLKEHATREALVELLKHVGDCERIIGRIALARASVQDYASLALSLAVLPQLKKLLQPLIDAALVRVVYAHIDDFVSLIDLLSRALNTDLEAHWIIKKGFDPVLDTMRETVEQAHTAIIALEQQEQKNTGINSLKIRYNQVHGYYIEITKANIDSVPDYYKRQQTLVGKERYMIAALAQLQHEISSARNQIAAVEKEIFERIQQQVRAYVPQLRKTAHALAHVDALVGLALAAYEHNFIRPALNDTGTISISAGKHPIINQLLQEKCRANDTLMNDQERLLILTGPNMGGKSTYLRQVALICLLAHMGSFVPAQSADIALLDRIFTRIGAGDNLAQGKSTFLVEMEETAAICQYATRRSLVILDEVGRGTSTFDGLAIAQAVVEYLFTKVQARCLFATHYHELALLEEQHPGIVSYYMASSKTKQGILFLYTIKRGIANGSFGLEVAKLAQLPPAIIERSEKILHSMQSKSEHAAVQTSHVESAQVQAQLEQLHAQLEKTQHKLRLLAQVDYDHLSPKQAFDLLWKLREV